MSPADAISLLDGQIAGVGQPVVLRRVVANAPAIERPHRAFVRGYRPDEVTGGIQQNDSLLIMSPTGMPREFTGADILRVNDRVSINGRMRNVQFVDAVRIGDQVVRYNVSVRG